MPSDMSDVPPTVISLETPESHFNASTTLPWVQSMSLDSLWRSAKRVTLEAEAVAAAFGDRGFGRAMLFAFLAELLAIGSVALVLLVLIAAVLPKVAIRVALNPDVGWSVAMASSAGVLMLASLMVILHWIWACGVEVGAWHCGLPRRWQSGLCLASYSCGWDLVTSPYGVVALWFTAGAHSVAPGLAAALRAPRRCVVSYLKQARSFSPEEQRRVLLTAALLTAPIVLMLAASLLVVIVAILA